MITTLAVLSLCLAAPPAQDRPSETPEPPLKVIARYKLPPFGPDEFDQSYEAKLQNARLASPKYADARALAETESARIAQYPGHLSMGQRERLYRLELKWIERERKRRDDLVAWDVLDRLNRQK